MRKIWMSILIALFHIILETSTSTIKHGKEMKGMRIKKKENKKIIIFKGYDGLHRRSKIIYL